MRYITAFLLAMIGCLIIIWGDKPIKVKEGKIIKAMDSLSNYGSRLKWLASAQRIMVKIALGFALIFLSIMIFLGKL